MKGNQTRLFIGTPCYGGMVTARYMQSVCALLCHKIPDLHVSIYTIGYDSLVTRGRNSIVAAFLDLPAETHLMFIDADIDFNVGEGGPKEGSDEGPSNARARFARTLTPTPLP